MLVGDVVDRQQLDGGDAERGEVLERRLRREAGVGASQLLAHAFHQLREALGVDLVDHRLVPGPLRVAVVLPIERLVDHDRLRNRTGVVVGIALEIGVLAGRKVGQRVAAVPEDRPFDRLGVRIDQELAGVEAVTLLRRPAAVDAEAVALARLDPGR